MDIGPYIKIYAFKIIIAACKHRTAQRIYEEQYIYDTSISYASMHLQEWEHVLMS